MSPPPGPPSTLPSPGYCSVPAQLLVSTDTVRTGKKKNTPQDQQSATEAVLPKLSSQPENLCIPAVQADTMTDVSVTLSKVVKLHHTYGPVSTLCRTCSETETQTASMTKPKALFD